MQLSCNIKRSRATRVARQSHCSILFFVKTEEIELISRFKGNDISHSLGSLSANSAEDDEVLYFRFKLQFDLILPNIDDGLCLVPHDDRRDCGWAGIKDWQCQVTTNQFYDKDKP